MTAGEAQLRFAADFAVFLVAGSGLALLVVRPQLLVAAARARGVVMAGFAALVAAAFVSGGGYADDPTVPALVAVRAGGAVLVAAALVRWRGGPVGRVALVAGVLALLGAEAAAVRDAPTVADALRLLGAAALAAATFLAARRSIPTRIATSASATLLVVVLAVSVALSAVLADNVEDEARRGLADRAGAEGAVAEDAGRIATFNATLTAQTFGANLGPQIRALALQAPNGATAVADLETSLQRFADELLRDADPQLGPILVVADADQRRLAVAVPTDSPPLSEAVLAGVQGSRVVTSASQQDATVQSIVTAGDTALAVAASPIVVPNELGVREAVAVLVVTSRLDDSYLDGRMAQGRGADDGVAFATRAAVTASAGDTPGDAAVVAAATAALDRAAPVTRLVGERLVTAQPVLGADGAPALALVASTPTAALQESRADLFRLLFLVAIGGTVLALVLTAIVGERIGAGLRRLTAAAGEVRGGNLDVDVGVDSDDELGVLSEAFGSMTGSLRRMTGELRQAADDEVRLRTRLEAVVGGMAEAVVAVDAAGTITDYNPAAELLTGVPADAAVGRPVAEVVRAVADDGPDLGARLARPVEEEWAAGGSVLHASGVEVPVAVSAGPLRDPDEHTVGAVLLLRDVRREREVERVKNDLLSNISHELRTPLSPIKGYSQILRARELAPDDVRRFANEIEKASARLERVVVQLVNFASMSAGRYEVRTEPTVVRDVVERVAARWGERLDGSPHEMTCAVDAEMPKIWLDRQAMDQALDELMDNAVKYSPDGGAIHLSAAIVDHERVGTAVRVAVADAGVGIPADRLHDVLEDFTQVDASNTRAFGGLGLGLAVVGRIARAHGGDLEVGSHEGVGTVAAMVLPIGEEG